MTQDLKKRTIISVLWNALDKVGFQVVAFCVGLVTLRLLTPRDFGLIGALAIFTALANILVESGFTLAMVRRRNNTNAEYFAVFCFNMLLSISFYLLLVFSADSIAAYYNMPELKELAPVLFVSIRRSGGTEHEAFCHPAFGARAVHGLFDGRRPCREQLSGG